VDGTPVSDAAGDKVGDVVEHNEAGSCMILHKGWLSPKDVYAPYSAIHRKTTDGIYLNMTKRQLQDQNWECPPGLAGDMLDTTTDFDTSRSGVVGAGTMAADTTGLTWTDACTSDTTATSDRVMRVPVREEELSATKTPQEAGRVHVNHDLVEEQQTLNVPVTHEEDRVERVPVQGDAVGTPPLASGRF
jgi:hypothetical protein